MTTPVRKIGIETVGHGGAGDFFPGNSRQALEQAVRLGVDRVEFDVQESGDGELLLLHDERIRAGNGDLVAVRAARTPDLRRLIDGLLTFAEALEVLGPDLPLIVDVKAPGFERLLVAELGRLARGRDVIVSTTYVQTIRTVKRAIPRLRYGLSTGHLATAWNSAAFRSLATAMQPHLLPRPMIAAARWCGATEVMIQHHVCSDLLVQRCHAAGLGVYAWTVDRPAHIDRVIGHGVDGIISNRPDLVRERLETISPAAGVDDRT
ncbi:MAG: glycerophosphodiester phosphodiesterase [Thermomicrobiales bacterium]